MEYVEGTDLDRLVKQAGPLAIEKACAYLRQAALGLQHAHERGLVHRDVKPANLLLSGKEVVKVLDLGLARVHQAMTESRFSRGLTAEGTILGTPDYMAPEQLEDPHQVDIRADIYSLGCALYYLLSGQVPFPNCALFQKLLKIQQAEPTPIETLRPDVPASLAMVLRRMMAKDRDSRYQTPGEVAQALASIGQGVVSSVSKVVASPRWSGPPPALAAEGAEDNTLGAVSVGGLGAALQADSDSSTTLQAAPAAEPKETRRSRRLLVICSIVFVLGVGSFFWLLSNAPRGTERMTASEARVAHKQSAPASELPFNTILDPTFETPRVGVGNGQFNKERPELNAYMNCPANSPWKFTDPAGIAGNNGAFTFENDPAPDGTQVAYLHGTGGISQTVNFTAGRFKLHFYAADRCNIHDAPENTFDVFIDDKKIGEFRTPKGKKTYKRYSTAEFGVSAGLHTIAFRGTAVSDKSTSLLDLVELERVKPAK
jgi:hypothetical protein